MSGRDPERLAKREREVMEFLYRRGESSAREVLDGLEDPPSYSAVRALLKTMKDKGLVRHREQARRYLYRPAVSPAKAKHRALRNLVTTFFGGRPEQLVASLLDPSEQQLSREEIERIRRLIEEHQQPSR